MGFILGAAITAGIGALIGGISSGVSSYNQMKAEQEQIDFQKQRLQEQHLKMSVVIERRFRLEKQLQPQIFQ